jgi:hypothetical protein
MLQYAIIETDAGLTVTELQPGTTVEEIAEREGGVIVDPGPYSSLDDAYDAALTLKDDEDEDAE